MKKPIELINIPTDTILNLKMVELSSIPYDKEKEEYIFPENEINIYYWDKGYAKSPFFKAELSIGGDYFYTTGDETNSSTNFNKYFEELRIELVNECIFGKWDEICSKYYNIFKDLNSDDEDSDEIDSIDVIEYFQKVGKPSISYEDLEFISFLKKRFFTVGEPFYIS